ASCWSRGGRRSACPGSTAFRSSWRCSRVPRAGPRSGGPASLARCFRRVTAGLQTCKSPRWPGGGRCGRGCRCPPASRWPWRSAGVLAAVLLVAMGAARLGRLVEFIPHPVTTGFTAGIATVIATLQLKDVLGLHVGRMPDRFPEKVAALWAARGSASLVECGVAAATLALLLLAPRLTRRVPAPLVAIGAVTFAVWAFGVPADTLGTRFHTTIDGREVAGIPPQPPLPSLPRGATPLTLR